MLKCIAITLVFLISLSSYAQTYHASEIAIDHFKLNDEYVLKIATKIPFNTPCDIDQIDEDSSVAFYQGSECRGHTFPLETTVIMFLGDQEYMRLKTMIWLKGSYFNNKVTLPLKVGDNAEDLEEHFGAAKDSFLYARGEFAMRALRYEGNINALVINDKIFGFVLGHMPDNWRHEKWRNVAGISYDIQRN